MLIVSIAIRSRFASLNVVQIYRSTYRLNMEIDDCDDWDVVVRVTFAFRHRRVNKVDDLLTWPARDKSVTDERRRRRWVCDVINSNLTSTKTNHRSSLYHLDSVSLSSAFFECVNNFWKASCHHMLHSVYGVASHDFTFFSTPLIFVNYPSIGLSSTQSHHGSRSIICQLQKKNSFWPKCYEPKSCRKAIKLSERLSRIKHETRSWHPFEAWIMVHKHLNIRLLSYSHYKFRSSHEKHCCVCLYLDINLGAWNLTCVEVLSKIKCLKYLSKQLVTTILRRAEASCRATPQLQRRIHAWCKWVWTSHSSDCV